MGYLDPAMAILMGPGPPRPWQCSVNSCSCSHFVLLQPRLALLKAHFEHASLTQPVSALRRLLPPFRPFRHALGPPLVARTPVAALPHVLLVVALRSTTTAEREPTAHGSQALPECSRKELPVCGLRRVPHGLQPERASGTAYKVCVRSSLCSGLYPLLRGGLLGTLSRRTTAPLPCLYSFVSTPCLLPTSTPLFFLCRDHLIETSHAWIAHRELCIAYCILHPLSLFRHAFIPAYALFRF
jgi:hypothetical protein